MKNLFITLILGIGSFPTAKAQVLFYNQLGDIFMEMGGSIFDDETNNV